MNCAALEVRNARQMAFIACCTHLSFFFFFRNYFYGFSVCFVYFTLLFLLFFQLKFINFSVFITFCILFFDILVTSFLYFLIKPHIFGRTPKVTQLFLMSALQLLALFLFCLQMIPSIPNLLLSSL